MKTGPGHRSGKFFFLRSGICRSVLWFYGSLQQKTAGADALAVHADTLTGDKFHGKINRLCDDGEQYAILYYLHLP